MIFSVDTYRKLILMLSMLSLLQKATYKSFKPELKEFYLSNVSSVDTKQAIQKNFGNLKWVWISNFTAAFCLDILILLDNFNLYSYLSILM